MNTEHPSPRFSPSPLDGWPTAASPKLAGAAGIVVVVDVVFFWWWP